MLQFYILFALEPKEDTGDYDSLNEDDGVNLSDLPANDSQSGSTVVMESDATEGLKMEIIQNPYYDGGVEIPQNLIANNTRLGVVADLNEVEIITATTNLYYDL